MGIDGDQMRRREMGSGPVIRGIETLRHAIVEAAGRWRKIAQRSSELHSLRAGCFRTDRNAH